MDNDNSVFREDDKINVIKLKKTPCVHKRTQGVFFNIL